MVSPQVPSRRGRTEGASLRLITAATLIQSTILWSATGHLSCQLNLHTGPTTNIGPPGTRTMRLVSLAANSKDSASFVIADERTSYTDLVSTFVCAVFTMCCSS